MLLHLFFSWIIFVQLSPSLSADVLSEAWGLLKRFYDSVAFLAPASARMTHGSARVGVSSLELAWVVPHLHLFLSHVMSSSLRSVFPLLRHANMISCKCFTTFKVSKKSSMVGSHLRPTKKAKGGPRSCRCKTAIHLFQFQFLFLSL